MMLMLYRDICSYVCVLSENIKLRIPLDMKQRAKGRVAVDPSQIGVRRRRCEIPNRG